MKSRKLIIMTAAIAGLMLGSVSVAMADDTFCAAGGPETLGAVTVDNVLVSGGFTCTLAGTTVEGNVKVEPGSSLRVFAPTSVEGNIQSDGGIFVQLLGLVTVDGDVQVKGASGIIPSGFNLGTTIGGNVQFEENASITVFTGASIGGDLQVYRNARSVIGVNTIGGNLQCKDNFPAPGPMGVNVVTGDKDDQCDEALGF